MAMIEFVGVDGCPAGWFGVGFDRYGGYEVNVFSSFGELLDRYRDAGLVLVDIPIGLPEGPERRECDSLARKLLGRRGSSVFPSPTRQAVEHAAAHPKDYRGALAVERRFAGKGISRQAFAISSKIAEVDAAMRSRGAGATPIVREVHPELCFWALNDRQSMRFTKKRSAGVAERLDVLNTIEPRSREIYEQAGSEFRRKIVGRDDIVDALVAALVARERVERLTSVPVVPPRDAQGLPMEMVY